MGRTASVGLASGLGLGARVGVMVRVEIGGKG